MSLGIGPHDEGCKCDRCESRRAANAQGFLQDVALALDLANMELQTIDEVLARRPALSGLKHRTEKIERACQVNGELLRALQDLLFVVEVPSHWGALQKEAFQLAAKKAEAAIRNANGQ
jgi:hypothetical protein